MLLYEKYSYKKKKTIWTDADAAVRNIQKGKRVLIGSGCAEPHHLVEALVRNAPCFRDNEVVHILTVGIAPYADPRYARNFRHNAFFIGHNIRESVREGHSDYMPIFLSEIPRLFKARQMPLHAVLIQVSPPDAKGFVSLGVSVDILPAAITSADIVIAQINRNMPATCGEARIPLSCIDFLVEADEPLIEFPQGDPDEVSMKIGKHLSRYVRDGDTLQLGIGAIPNAVLLHLKDKHDLGIHSEMVSDGIIELYRNGNITNKRKRLNKGKTVISRNPNVVSINSAIQIDLTGQVCSDSIGERFYSGFGGQVDFVRGAKRSEGGRSFIAIPSTAKNGTVSRIVPSLAPGAGVVTTRADVQYVATEYGVAYLKEKHYVYTDQRILKDDDSLIKDNIPHSRTFKGKTVYFRPLRPFDEKAIQDFFYSHRPETIYQRYLTNVEALPHEEAQMRVSVDYNKDMAIAGFDDWTPYAQMVCLGRYIRDEKNQAEIGLVVKENYQGIGIGKFMCAHLVESAKLHGIARLFAYAAHSNTPMLAIFKRFGFSMKESRQIQGYYLSLDLPQSAPLVPAAASEGS